MPLRDYSAKAAYDADYSIRYRTPAPMLLPAASVRFIGKSLTPAPGWPQVKHGGELRLSLGPDNPHSIIGRVADVTGDTITLMMPDERSWADSTELVAAGRARYAIPEVPCRYLSCSLRSGTYEMMDAIVAALGMTPPATVISLGCGMGWEVERLVDLGFNAIGAETSAWIQSSKSTSEVADVDAALIAAGYDPTKGQGLELRMDMLSLPRSRIPERILNEALNTGTSQRTVRDWFGLRGNAKVDWAITVAVMESLLDTEFPAINNNLLSMANNVGHLITVLPDVWTGWNAKTAEQWAALLAPARIVINGNARAGFQVI